jgi:NADH-quinone oxidoreductase subunit J
VTGDLVFILLALLTIVPAIWVVFSPNIVHAGFALLFTLMGAAGLYAYMGADFIAVTQLMVYIGGVLVLVLFTVMMTRVPTGRRANFGLDRYVPAAVFALAVFGLIYKTITSVEWGGSTTVAQPTTAEIGTNFMTNYIFPFEYVSLVLLAAMIGAAILIREQKPSEEEAVSEETEVQS